MRLLKQRLKGFPQQEEGQMRSQLCASDNSVERRLFPNLLEYRALRFTITENHIRILNHIGITCGVSKTTDRRSGDRSWVESCHCLHLT